jgi:multiple sugar transport system substrate-binding protein
MKALYSATIIAGMLFASACGNGVTPTQTGAGGDSAAAGKEAEPAKPVTLEVFPIQGISEDDFAALIANPVKQKYPNITVELIDKSKNKLEEYIAAAQPLDFILNWQFNIPSTLELGIYEDLNPWIKKTGFDIGKFDPQAIDAVKAVADKGELYGLPYNVQFNALYYNKDVFDKFGVGYPADGMNWDSAIDLAKKLSRSDGGVDYNGLDAEGASRMGYAMGLDPVIVKNGKPEGNAQAYKSIFELDKMMYSIPGNKPKKVNGGAGGPFVTDKRTAMAATINILDQLEKSDLNWDVAQYPSYPERPNTYGMFDLHTISISAASKHKDEAMKVLEVFFSNDIQMQAAKSTGRVPAMKDAKYREAFGSEQAFLKGKHLQSIFKSKPATTPKMTKFHAKGVSLLGTEFVNYINGKKDVNTALRDADEAINQYIRDDGAK